MVDRSHAAAEFAGGTRHHALTDLEAPIHGAGREGVARTCVRACGTDGALQGGAGSGDGGPHHRPSVKTPDTSNTQASGTARGLARGERRRVRASSQVRPSAGDAFRDDHRSPARGRLGRGFGQCAACWKGRPSRSRRRVCAGAAVVRGEAASCDFLRCGRPVDGRVPPYSCAGGSTLRGAPCPGRWGAVSRLWCEIGGSAAGQ